MPSATIGLKLHFPSGKRDRPFPTPELVICVSSLKWAHGHGTVTFLWRPCKAGSRAQQQDEKQ